MVVLLVLLAVVLLVVAVFGPGLDSFWNNNRVNVEAEVTTYRARREQEVRRLKAQVAYETERALQELRKELESL